MSILEKASDFKALVRLLTTEESGLNKPVRIGYRPLVWFDLSIKGISSTSGSWQKMEKEILFPGEIAQVEIAILVTTFYKNKLFVGLKFRLTEGSRLIGEGEILEIYNKELEA